MMRFLLPYVRYLLLGLCMPGFMAHAGPAINAFRIDTYQGIREARSQESFLMVLWSLDCPPCIEEMQLLGRFHGQYPDKKMILVSTDTDVQHNEIIGLMQQYGLQDVEHWVFAGSPQHLRYAIDPGWYGELPRSYFHGADKQRRAFSGRLHYEQLVAWFVNRTTEQRLKE